MGKKKKQKHLQPLIWTFALSILLSVSALAYFIWQGMQEGKSAKETLSGLASIAQEKHQAYTQYWEEKTPTPIPTPQASPANIELLAASIAQFKSFAQEAGADIHCPKIFEKARRLHTKGFRAFRQKEHDDAIQYIKEATALYAQAETTAKEKNLYDELYKKFITRADKTHIQNMLNNPSENNQLIVAAYKDESSLGTNTSERLQHLKAVIRNYPTAVSAAQQTEASAQQQKEHIHLKKIHTAGDWKQSVQATQSALARKHLSPKKALSALWDIMEKVDATAKEKAITLTLPTKQNASITLIYIAAQTPYWIAQHETSRHNAQLIAPKSIMNSGEKNDPAYGVSWHAASNFCERLSKKWELKVTLPSEKQWEFACRAGTSTPYSFGEKIKTFAHYNKTTWSKPGTYPANAWGLYDMHGNLMEWCREPYNQKKTNGPRLLRGGCWKFGPELCRSDARYRYLPHLGNEYIGFRIVVEK